MFVELMPLLAGRTVLITVAKVDDETIRVNVIPALAKADENAALTTPLTYTGPPEELDAQLGRHLAGYVRTHTQTASTLAEAKATMEAAARAAQEEAKRKAEERKKASQKPSDKGTAAMAAEPASASSSASPTPATYSRSVASNAGSSKCTLRFTHSMYTRVQAFVLTCGRCPRRSRNLLRRCRARV